MPRRLDGPRGDLPLRRRAPARARGGRVRDRPRLVRERPSDGRVGADRAPGARGGPRDRGARRRHAGGPGRVPRPAARGDARVHADVGRRPLARRDPVRPRRGQQAAARQRAPSAVGARQDRRARHARAPGDEPARAGAPAAGADRPRARRTRGRDPAPVRRAARVLQPGRAVARSARADRGRAAGRAVRPPARAPAPARARRAGDEHHAARGGRPAAARAPGPGDPARARVRARARAARARIARAVGAGGGRAQRAQARAARRAWRSRSTSPRAR